jgi:hypothetical protein
MRRTARGLGISVFSSCTSRWLQILFFLSVFTLASGSRIALGFLRLRGAGDNGIQKQLIEAVDEGNLDDIVVLVKVLYVGHAFLLFALAASVYKMFLKQHKQEIQSSTKQNLFHSEVKAGECRDAFPSLRVFPDRFYVCHSRLVAIDFLALSWR